jgi:DNA primase
MMENIMPDSQELADEVAYSVRVMEIQEYGKDRLPAGPAIDESDEIIVVEGRADVLNLLKHGIKNSIAINGTSVPDTIIELSKKKVVTAFVDGDRGGNLIIKELTSVADIDYVTKAPDGKEVEEITKKEIHKALRGRVSAEQAKLDLGPRDSGREAAREAVREAVQSRDDDRGMRQRPQMQQRQQYSNQYAQRKAQPTPEEKKKFKDMLDDLVGTRGAYILDNRLSVLGKVPVTELATTLKSLSSGVYAIAFDGIVERELVSIAEKNNINFIIGMDSKVRPTDTRVGIVTVSDF